jgi:hypothetical protein
MKQEVKLLLVAGVGYLGYKFYLNYQAIKNLGFSPTGINFTWIKSRSALGGTMFVDVINPTQKYLTIDGISGTVVTSDGTIIGDYKLGKTVLSPGAKNVRISWGGRSSATLITLVAGMINGKWPKLTFKSVVTYRGLPVPDSITIDTSLLKPSFA